MATGAGTPKVYSKSLNGIRFFCALVVVFAHAGFVPMRNIGTPDWVLNLIQARSLATSLFFLMSGFLVTLSVSRQPVRHTDFLLRRVARIYPIHLACFLAVFVEAWSSHVLPPAPELLLHCALWGTMLQGLFPGVGLQYNYPAWAVTAFMLGYVFTPVFAAAVAEKPRQTLIALVPLWIGALFPSVFVVRHFGPGFLYTLDPWLCTAPPIIAGIGFAHTFAVTRLLEIAMGSIVAILVRDHGGSALLRLLAKPAITAGLAVAMIALVEFGSRDTRALYLMTHGLLLPLLILFMVSLWMNKGIAERLLGTPLLERAGRASILIYFIHVPILVFVRLSTGYWGMKPGDAQFWVSLAIILAASYWLQPAYDAFSWRLARLLQNWAHRNPTDLKSVAARV
jgi:peptidoglycan/LPS O-acetylase OafA/YrhL